MSEEDFDRLRAGAEILEQDQHGIKVMRLADGNMLKLFRVKRWWSSARFLPYSRRFCHHAQKLSRLDVPTVQILGCFRLPGQRRTAVRYQPLPGMTLRQVHACEGLNAEKMAQFGRFVATLHRQGIYFRSLHLGNIVSTPVGELGLIDIADIKFHASGLSNHLRLRNLRHICRLPVDREIMGVEGWIQFVRSYVDSSVPAITFNQRFISQAMTMIRPLEPPLSKAEITVTTRTGKVLVARPGDEITTQIQKHGEYDRNTLDSIRDILGALKPRLVLDIGANIGNHALVMAGHARQLIAFEPVPFVFSMLERNMAMNHLDNVRCVRAGLSNVAEKRPIYVPKDGNLGAASLEAQMAEHETFEIETLVGDQFMKEHFSTDAVDFMKIDVEGHEAEALMGLRETIAASQPLVLMEYRSARTVAAFRDAGILEDLFSGYRVYSLATTTSKKALGRTPAGYLRRIFNKLTGERWCFAGFDPSQRYSNVYLVPPRFIGLIGRFIKI